MILIQVKIDQINQGIFIIYRNILQYLAYIEFAYIELKENLFYERFEPSDYIMQFFSAV